MTTEALVLEDGALKGTQEAPGLGKQSLRALWNAGLMAR